MAKLYENMPAVEYFAHGGINRSKLWEMKRSAWHFHRALTEEKEQTREMFLGTAYHALVLEPDTFEEKYFVDPSPPRPEGDGRTKAVKQAVAEWTELCVELEREVNPQCNKFKLSPAEFAMLTQMAHNLRNLPQFQAALLGDHLIEATIGWTDPVIDILLKCRLDIWNRATNVPFDVKTCEDVSRFSTLAAREGYHLQDAMYCRGIEALTGETPAPMVFLVSEKQEPFESVPIICDDESRERAFFLFDELIERVDNCARKGVWPRFEKGIRTMRVPGWGF